MKPLKIEELMDRKVENFSGGELQRVALCLCLGKVKTQCIAPHVLSSYHIVGTEVP
jgi:ABC-type molybdate transport system ATPase subunit